LPLALRFSAGLGVAWASGVAKWLPKQFVAWVEGYFP
jgi:hypothetical protein